MNFLPQGGPSSIFVQNYVNPLSTSAGTIGGQLLALEINVDFSDAGIFQSGFGDLIVVNSGISYYDNMSIRSILNSANQIVGGFLPIPPTFTISDLNNLLDNLNKSYDNGVMSDWSIDHIRCVDRKTDIHSYYSIQNGMLSKNEIIRLNSAHPVLNEGKYSIHVTAALGPTASEMHAF